MLRILRLFHKKAKYGMQIVWYSLKAHERESDQSTRDNFKCQRIGSRGLLCRRKGGQRHVPKRSVATCSVGTGAGARRAACVRRSSITYGASC